MRGREINLFYSNLWYCHSQIISQLQVPLLTKWTRQPWQSPYKPQYLHTNSPNWSLYISLLNPLGEFDKRSEHFPFVIILLTLITFSIDDVLILFGENWGWSLLGVKRTSWQAIPEGDAFTRVTVYFCFFLSFSRSLADTLHIALDKCLGAAGTLRLPLLMPYRCIAPGEKDILNFPLIYNHSKVPQGN